MVVNGPRAVEAPQQPPERKFLGGVTNKTAKLSFVDEERFRKVRGGGSSLSMILIYRMKILLGTNIDPPFQ